VNIGRIGALGLALLTLGTVCVGSKVEAQQKVVIYSSNDDTLHKLVFAAFTKETGIAVEPISAGSGVVMKRIQTEKDRPGGDIVWGVSRSLLDTNKQYFSAYLSKNNDATPAEYREPTNLWIGNNLHLLVILQNTKVLPEDQGPKTWADLLDPKWKGKVAFTDPANSGSAYSTITMLVDHFGGGDTGSDCIGTSFRQGAKSVTQLEIMPMPPTKENKALSWPHWPLKLRVSSSQAEGAKVEYSISTTGFSGSNGKVEKLLHTRVDGALKPVPGTEGELPANLVLFAMGFSGPVETDLVQELGLAVVPRGRFKGLDADERDYRIKGRKKVFAAGDMRRGQSLVVWAIREGRQAAHAIDKLLMGRTDLPR